MHTDSPDPDMMKLVAKIDALERSMIPLTVWKGGSQGPKAFLGKRPDGWTILVTIRDDFALFVTRERASQFAQLLQRDVQAMHQRIQKVYADAARRESTAPAQVVRADAERRLRESAIRLEGLLYEIGHDARIAGLRPSELTDLLALPEWYLTHVFRAFKRELALAKRRKRPRFTK